MFKEYKRVTYAENCTGCFACEVACKQEHSFPVGPRWIRVFPDVRETGDRLWFTYLVTECHRAATPPCTAACPAELNIWRYVQLAAVGRFEEALAVVRATTPFAGVLGYVCTRPCEGECERGHIDIPVAIRSIKAFLADYDMKAGRKRATPVKKTKKDKVAIVGAGPAGLSCAYDLVRQGYPVTVFEADSGAGGLMRWSIPEFRLPGNIVENEISYIEEMGVEIKVNTPVKSLNEIFDQGYKAIFLGIGAGTSQRMDIPGEDSPGVLYALDFLRQVNSGAKVGLGGTVAVIGGGNAAVDAARVVRRLGVEEVTLVYRRTRAEMPATPSEVEDMEREGVKVQFLATPVKVLSDKNGVKGIECIRMEMGAADDSGRRRPVPIKGSEFTVDVDNVIMAIGQAMDKAMLPGGLAYTNRGTLAVDPITLQTSIEGVFAGGDVVSGPSDIVGAIGAAREAAISIDRYLSGADMKEGRTIHFRLVNGAPLAKGTKQAMVTVLDEKLAIAEARRCLNCGTCVEGLDHGKQPACVSACPAHALYYHDMWELTPKKVMHKL
jgi:NADPH-dependent glutamate synthase beta subunit-like oxidoreductase